MSDLNHQCGQSAFQVVKINVSELMYQCSFEGKFEICLAVLRRCSLK